MLANFLILTVRTLESWKNYNVVVLRLIWFRLTLRQNSEILVGIAFKFFNTRRATELNKRISRDILDGIAHRTQLVS